MKVCKFGGVAMAAVDSVKRVAEILESDSDRRIAVVSAIGKRFDGDRKVTDLLYACVFCDSIKQRHHLLDEVFDRYYRLYQKLNVDFDLDPFFEEYSKKIDLVINNEEILSVGEFLSALLFSKYLGWRCVDPKGCIRFCAEGVDYQKSYELVRKEFQSPSKAVISGFYGADENGKIRVLSRGGSDVTGAIVARGVNADLYENWTDVNGYYVVDPTVIENPKHIDYLSYDELMTLSLAGSGALHYDCVIPLRGKIPIIIKSVFEENKKGTFVSEKEGNISYIAYKRNLTRISIKKDVKLLSKELFAILLKRATPERLVTETGKTKLYFSNLQGLTEIANIISVDCSVDELSVLTIGASRETFNRIINKLDNEGLKDITIYDKELSFAVDNDKLEDTIRIIYNEL